MQFPKDFKWGTATAAHQIEGNNVNSDWWHWEKNENAKHPFPGETSGIACDSYNRYEEDFDLAKNMNNNAIRISIAWSRIEPKEGEWDEKEIEHYKKVLKAAKDRGLETYVTLYHFTKPQWFAEKGGWKNILSPYYFSRYAKKCASEFDSLIDTYATINEPQVYVMQAYVRGVWTPNKKNYILALITQITQMKAHNMAYKAIKKVSKKPVGIVKNVVWYKPRKNEEDKASLLDKITAKFMFFIGCDFFLKPLRRHMDFIGLNYYFTAWVHKFKEHQINNWTSDLGWELHPEGLEPILKHLNKYKLPIYITEHGLADAWDHNRQKYLEDSLEVCLKCIEEGVNLKGYFHWSLIDNFEWHIGFWPKFGLIEIDRENNLARKPRPTSEVYSKICETGKLK